MLSLIARGKSNREIGTELFITPKTASVHVSNILGKLGATLKGRTEAAAIAYREERVEPTQAVSPAAVFQRHRSLRRR